MTKRLQASFISGEIGPRFQGRVDLDLFYQSAKTIKNWIILPGGGVENRAGTKYVDNVCDSDQRLVLFSTGGSNYIFIFCNLKIFIIKDGAVLQQYLTDYYITSPYTTANLWKLSFAQSADALYITSEDYQTRKLTRTADTNWTLAVAMSGEQGPWRKPYTLESKTISPQTKAYYENNNGPDIILEESGASPYLLISENYLNCGHPSVIDQTDIQWKALQRGAAGGANYATFEMLYGPFGYAYNKNFRFKSGIEEWEDASTGDASISFATSGKLEANNGTTPLSYQIASCTNDTSLDASGLSSTTTYYFIINTVEYSITTAAALLHGDIASLINTALSGQGFICEYSDDDNGYKISIITPGKNYSVSLEAGTSGTDLFTSMTNFDGYDDAVAGNSVVLRQNNIPIEAGTNLVAFIAWEYDSTPRVPPKVLADYDITIRVGTTPGASDIGSSNDIFHNFKTNAPYACITMEYANYYEDEKIYLNIFAVTERDPAFSTRHWRVPLGDKSGEYSKAVSIYNQRLVLAGSSDYPHRVDHSKITDITNFNFDSPTQDDDAFNYDIDSRKPHDIRWLSELNGLALGTSNGIFKITGTQNTIVAPGDVFVDQRSDIGCAAIPPEKVANNLLVVRKGGKDIYQIKDNSDFGFLETQLNYISEHLFEGTTIKDWAYQTNPYKMLWVVLSSGTLLGCLYIPDQQVSAWQQFETDGQFTAVEMFPGEDIDTMYFVVKRTINGSDKYYIEILMPRIDDEDTYDFFFVDSGVEYVSPGTATLTGLDHLEGESVYAVCDGAVKGPYAVSSGAITVNASTYSVIKVGLKYNSDLECLDLSREPGEKKRIQDMLIHVYKTRNLKAGKNSSNLDLVQFRDAGLGGNPPDLFTGYKRAEFDYEDERIATSFFRNDEPVPCTILSIVPDYGHD